MGGSTAAIVETREKVQLSAANQIGGSIVQTTINPPIPVILLPS
ncbi:hypothetical protein [Pediococcus acidilactici]|nr:hypothetical protein [Pediococcus acidilactici]MDM5043202.1 hypothetical protein [Pediococcus acidilactici]MDO7802084.1 hypothetical protein [Pediococcus acidilactici]WIL71849.1 hypothetical protein QMY06_09600 [Pediococcus acidilactici]